MTKFQFFRKWIQFLRRARPLTDLAGLILALGLFVYHSPPELFNSGPATGGDTGSHFWPLVTLVQEGLPEWQIRVWNPGNLGGEPHHTHYFPLPYLVMALLSFFMPLGKAFNIGTWLPVFLFPVCVYFCFRGLKARFPIPILASLFSLSFLYNESFSMWGGNFLSTLAGQFAHVYAHDFFLLGIGCLFWEMSRRKFPWLSLFLFTGVMLSHFYVVLFLPPVFLVFLFLHPTGNLKERFSILLRVGLGALLLSAWFVLPMLHNSKWNTAFGLKWYSANLMMEAFPPIFWPWVAIGLLAGIASVVLAKKRNWPEHEWKLFPFLFCFLIAMGAFYFFIFPPLGLVDIRAFPMMQMVLCFIAALFLGLLMRQTLPSVWVWFLTVSLMTATVWWPQRQIVHLPHWLKWNYSSWAAKTSYSELQRLSSDLKGDFSQGRVIYENSQLSNSAGTMRVFEMLPYFAQRATLESVYMQATILAPAAFYTQALISQTPSCPFPNYQCTTKDISRVPDYLQLLGVTQLILISPEVRAQADVAPFLKLRGQYDIWYLYDSALDAPLVEVPKLTPKFLETRDFKPEFYQWFINYKKTDPYLVQAEPEDRKKIVDAVTENSCQPRLTVDFNQLILETDCPGKFHVVKFAFHSTFKASTGDELFLTSPGFIGLIPSQNKVVLKWGQHWFWTLSNSISWISLICFLSLIVWQKFRRRGEG